MYSTGRSLAFKIIKYLTSRKFSTVKWITTEELARWLDDPVQRPILLDARTETEYTVSHLKSAARIDPYHPASDSLTAVAKDIPVVVYCSVGYRSARIAEWLQRSGFSCVYNLEGSILKWVDEGRPVFKNGYQTMRVHPYDSLWGKLLKSQYRQQ